MLYTNSDMTPALSTFFTDDQGFIIDHEHSSNTLVGLGITYNLGKF